MSIDHKEYCRAYYQANKESHKAKQRAYYKAHKEDKKSKVKEYYKEHKEEIIDKWKEDVNSLGEPKMIVRQKSRLYLYKHGNKIPGYEIHHCCTYTEPYKFIYCSKEIHLKIHAYLRANNIDADTDHYEQIKHLLDDTVVLYGLY